jgi:hypothetical protein
VELRHPMRPWQMLSRGVGSTAVSAAGIPETYVVRRDRVARVTLRLDEDELEAVIAYLEDWRDSGEAREFAFDQTEDSTEFEVYLDAPQWPEAIEPQRQAGYLPLFEIALELRTEDGDPFDLSWSGEDES